MLHRISLPPEKVLQLVQSSARREHYAFRKRKYPEASPRDGQTWRSLRYARILAGTPYSSDDDSYELGRFADEPTPSLSSIAKISSWVSLVFGSKSGRESVVSEVPVTAAETESSPTSFVTTYLTGRSSHSTETEDMEEMKRPGNPMDADLELAEISSSDDEEDPTWKWICKYDELTLAKAKGLVLHDFVEAPIRFPPSFRWRPKACAGNFTDLSILQGRKFKRNRLHSHVLRLCNDHVSCFASVCVPIYRFLCNGQERRRREGRHEASKLHR